jgi:hypothetical protein
MKEQRGSYDGPVEIWVGDAKRLDAQAQLVKHAPEIVTRTDPPLRRDGRESWDGYLVGLSMSERRSLFDGQQLDLKLPNGQTGRAVMTDYNSGALQGVREAPF